MIRRKIHTILSRGTGSQLLWLTVLCIVTFAVICLTARLFRTGLSWLDLASLFLGEFGAEGSHGMFRLIVTLAGCFAFSALLVSVFSNIIDNISGAWHNGEVRYRHKGHILILGGEKHIGKMLRETAGLPPRDIVVMTSSGAVQLRERLQREDIPEKVLSRLTVYSGRRDSITDLRSASADKASLIYVLGESRDEKEDPATLRCIGLLKDICRNSPGTIRCYALLHDSATTEIMERSTAAAETGALRADYVNRNEYEAEKLLVDTDFLPAITDAGESLDLLILGCSDIARAAAFTAAHIAHYPAPEGSPARTRITIAAKGASAFAERLELSREGLMRLSHWSVTREDGSILRHTPEEEYGDYLDIEWNFIDSSPESALTYRLWRQSGGSPDSLTRIIVCGDSDMESLHWYLHLPSSLRDVSTAVYLEESTAGLDAASRTGQYNPVTVFGAASDTSADALLLKRASRGKRVNYKYDRAYCEKPSRSAEEAWDRIPEAHKLSSINCGNAIPLRLRCISEDTPAEVLCETEHRRWMMSCLLTGYSPLPLKEAAQARLDKDLMRELKKAYIHPDIAPFSSLTQEEKDKDLLIVSNMHDIVTDRTKQQ